MEAENLFNYSTNVDFLLYSGNHTSHISLAKVAFSTLVYYLYHIRYLVQVGLTGTIICSNAAIITVGSSREMWRDESYILCGLLSGHYLY